jgi:curved DNA-binding protein CbpA
MDATPESPAKKPFYELLDVPADSTFDEIKRSYRKLALRHHPDKIVNSSAENDNGEKVDCYVSYCD